ncbi:uncharacterized protein DEA37_0000223 [Paragonimus westermani]|uniref:Helix-turn-helix domain-containing protein n=1 Tax=Paragonimus westermani TaxID=34504 RepID=A0A5J4P1C7_9TREM|nr:uncharacterized protein DEA37_0000223 [Paragonimus westermani]
MLDPSICFQVPSAPRNLRLNQLRRALPPGIRDPKEAFAVLELAWDPPERSHDILISHREDGSIKRAVYRKSTWFGQYLNFSSFTPVHHKRALVNTLFTRARRICTQDSIAKELDLITSILQSNGYPKWFIERHSRPKPPSEQVATNRKKKVYIELPFKGDYNMHQTTQRLVNLINRTFNAAELCVLVRTQKLPVPSIKGDQPVGATSHCVY